MLSCNNVQYIRLDDYENLLSCVTFPAVLNRDLTVHASDKAPVQYVSPDFSFSRMYKFCAKFSGVPPKSTDLRLKCKRRAIGQYVFVHVDGNGRFQACEVEVYGKATGKRTGRTPEYQWEFVFYILFIAIEMGSAVETDLEGMQEYLYSHMVCMWNEIWSE